ncbi:Cytoplasmic tRNA 2-thiolation protein 2 [Porites harrisoni]
MCSVQENEDLENVPTRLENKPVKENFGDCRTCMKCLRSQAVVVVRLNDPLCRSCFLAYFTHKFRATIGKARVIRAGEKVLLAFSGGPSSSAMLHLDIFTLEKSAQDDAICCKKFEKQESGNNSAEKLSNLFDVTLSMTAKEDLLRTLRCQLLLATARKEGYSKVMLADCATRISIRLLSDISQGRGADLPFDTGFSDNRHGDVTLIRPMREFATKEIALYNFFNIVETVPITTLGTMSHTHASIDRLTEEFVTGLQADFPFTVSTIFRTGDKLSAMDSSDDTTNCAFCGVPMNLGPNRFSALSDSKLDIAASSCVGDCDSECSSSSSGRWLTKQLVLETFCYGCQLTFRDVKFNPNDLPTYVVETANKIQQRAQMKEQIKDFLLDDN